MLLVNSSKEWGTSELWPRKMEGAMRKTMIYEGEYMTDSAVER